MSPRRSQLDTLRATVLRLTGALEEAQARVLKLEERLEITFYWVTEHGVERRVEIPPAERDAFTDGITCRDATITLVEAAADRARVDALRLREQNQKLQRQLTQAEVALAVVATELPPASRDVSWRHTDAKETE